MIIQMVNLGDFGVARLEVVDGNPWLEVFRLDGEVVQIGGHEALSSLAIALSIMVEDFEAIQPTPANFD